MTEARAAFPPSSFGLYEKHYCTTIMLYVTKASNLNRAIDMAQRHMHWTFTELVHALSVLVFSFKCRGNFSLGAEGTVGGAWDSFTVNTLSFITY